MGYKWNIFVLKQVPMLNGNLEVEKCSGCMGFQKFQLIQTKFVIFDQLWPKICNLYKNSCQSSTGSSPGVLM
jgi:hypothetical protein